MGNLYFGYIPCILYYVLSANGGMGEILDITGFNMMPMLPEGEDTFFGGYKSSTDIDATILLGRDVYTGTGSYWPPYPFYSQLDEPAGGSLAGRVTRIILPSRIGIERIGAFYINATKGGVSHRMITITMDSNAGVLPESQTKTVYVGQNVTLTMRLVQQNPLSMLEWRFNEVLKTSVNKADEGIYECYDSGQREQGRQGIMRLIVQECLPGWWNPPSCNQECPICYNGGICDAQSGQCVCPPGFGGTNCEWVHGSNRWGNDGALACSGKQDAHGDACKGRFFCRPDPYGCSCISGYQGLDCMTDCVQGTFGAGCTQECHCEGMSCLQDTGECSPGVRCMPGWTGINCQVRDPCPDGYYGSLCTERCRCKNNWPCNQQTGYCPGGCQRGYIGEECVDDGSPKLVSFRSQEIVNSGHVTILICSVTGNPIPSTAMVTVTNSEGTEIPLNISQKSGPNVYKRENRYQVVVSTTGSEFFCNLTLSSGVTLHKSYTVTVYTPPILTNVPTILSDRTTSSSVTIQWNRWDPSMGGDGPVVKYIIKYRESTPDPDAPYTNSVEIMDVNVLMKVVDGLHWHAEYDFVVVAVRAGVKGEGPPSPKVVVTTRCDNPTASPNITRVYAINSTAIAVIWRLPQPETWGCKRVQDVVIKWREKDSGMFKDPVFVPASEEMTIVTSLKPCVAYEFKTRLNNIMYLSGPSSPLVSGTSGTTVPGPVLNLTASGLTSNPTQIRATWKLPASNACPVDGYEVTYRKVEAIACRGSIFIARNITVPSTHEVFVLHNLDPYSRYQIVVSALNMEGQGVDTMVLEATTSAAPSAAPITNLIPPGKRTSLQFSWLQADCMKLNGPFNSYKYQLMDSNGNVTAGRQVRDMQYKYNVTFNNLKPCTDYFFRVRVSTDKGFGDYSEPMKGTTEIDVPGPVTELRIPAKYIMPTSLIVNWQEPSDPPCLPDNYNVQIRLIEKDQCEMATNTRSLISENTRFTNYRAMGLMPYSTYSVAVMAKTIIGYGSTMITEARTKAAAPTAPPSNVTGTNRQRRNLTFQWNRHLMARDTATSQSIRTDLLTHSEIQSLPGAPERVTTPSAAAQFIRVQWYPPDPPRGNITAYYVIYWQTQRTRQTNSSIMWTDFRSQPPYSYDISPLASQTRYSIVIEAETSVGRGPGSEPITKVTEEGYPSRPINLAVSARNQSELTITWEPPMTPNGNIKMYSITYRIIERPYDKTLPQMTPFKSLEVDFNANSRTHRDGGYATLNAYTSPSTSIDAPATNPEVDMSTEFPETAVAIRLVPATSKYVTAYYILVEKKTGISKRGGSRYQDSKDSYVAAELDKTSVQDTFVVGDNKTYGGYYNPPLEKGATYNIRQGSVSKSGDQVYMKAGPPLEYTAGSSNNGSDGGSDDLVSIVVGVIMGIAVVAFVSVLVAFIVIKKRQQKDVRMRKIAEANVIPLNNVIVSKNGNEENSRPKLKIINSEPIKTRMKRAESDDALSNLVMHKNGASHKPSMRRVTPTGHDPIRVDELAGYIKEKKAETKDGLKQEYLTLPEGKLHPWTAAMKPENKQKNRYGNIIAYDHSRVKLTPLDGISHSDYINACYIDGYRKGNAYIACQGPNLASVNDIWRMAWQEKSAKIIMVTNLNEGGKKKCEKYWPDTSKIYGDVEVTLTREENFTEYCTRTFTMQQNEESREITQFHFLFWPDMGVPSYAAPLLRFIKVAKNFNPPKAGPTIVHCSAGVGRTGTLLTIDSMLDMAKQENQIDVYNFVRSMRDRRIKMVQTPEQYVFIFDALLEALICGDTSCLTEAFCSEFRRLKTRKSLAGKSLMHEQYEALELVSIKLSPQTCRGGSDPINVNKNRYPDRLPFDKFRPYLMTEAGENCTNYVNASFLDGYIRKNMFFATQMPLPHTIIDFWRLIFDYNSNTIVMLNTMDHNDATMSQYWPEAGTMTYGPFIVELLSSDSTTDIITRTFYLTNSQRKLEKARKIRQFQYTGWPSGQDTPNRPDTILQLYSQVERWCPQTAEDSPITVHCLDGMGVTGTFCAIFMVLDRLKTEQSIDVFQAVKKLRVTRAGMVRCLDQYIFCYQTVLAYLDSMELYGNFRL
ncbi:receptor-type tyrosine-protein phosphatase delta-like [Amphiura filiformis]|uniref:receptor-type tyrosine-protein phosphatase delta-like n=1 Tax=Amphiura filiformis TaxID=82378 RepID=UPI003B20FA93